jgi:hypothetical protein
MNEFIQVDNDGLMQIFHNLMWKFSTDLLEFINMLISFSI